MLWRHPHRCERVNTWSAASYLNTLVMPGNFHRRESRQRGNRHGRSGGLPKLAVDE